MRTKTMRVKVMSVVCGLIIGLIAYVPSTTSWAQDDDTKISLVCAGSGTRSDNQTTYVNQHNKKSHERSTGMATTSIQRPYQGSVYIDIYGPMGRIKLPTGMLPIFQSDDDGWFDISKLKIADTEITGTVRINALNKPDVRIDRNTGAIEVHNSLGNFSGQCELYDKSAESRRF